MIANLSLDDMILEYSENPFVDEKMFSMPSFCDSKQKQSILSRLLLIASNLISPKGSETEPATYKRRYETK